MQYGIADGSSLIVWLDRGGNDVNGRTRHSDQRRAIVTTKPSDVINDGSQGESLAFSAVLSRNQEAALVTVSHFAYGTAMGALYAQLTRPQSPASAVAAGAAYGLAVWTGSYCGWLPIARLYRPPTQDTAERTALMIGAHLIWGGTTGLLVHWLSSRGAAGDDNAVRLPPGPHLANPNMGRFPEGAVLAR